MRTLKLALAAVAAFAFNANAAPVNGMGTPPTGTYQPWADGQTVVTGGAKVVFHGGGVAACDGCHVMHNAQYGIAKSTTGKGQSVQPWTNVTNAYLLQGSDQSSTCLICHGFDGASGVQFTVADTRTTFTSAQAPANFTPGGDFGWTNLGFTASPSDRHGHNVVAADFPGFAADGTLMTAPGGSYTVTATGIKAFGCASCHDPHGRYRWIATAPGVYQIQGPSTLGNKIAPIKSSGSYGVEPTATEAVGVYRILGGRGYAPASNPSYPFPNDPPRAIAPETYNQSEASSQVTVAYGTGMSEWCQNCHTNIHLDGYTTGVAGLRHPAGSTAFLHSTQYDIYNAYVSSGNMLGGPGAGYSSLVPFEQGGGKAFNQLATVAASGNIVADSQSNVMCLSCHRAHASAFDSMVRWDQNATFLADGADWTSGLTGGTRSLAQTTAGYYGRSGSSFPYQRSFCNKCHAKD